MGSPRGPLGLRNLAEKRIAPRFFSGIENRARAAAGARFSCSPSGNILTHLAMGLPVILLAPFWVFLGALLVSLRVLLVALRCLLGLTWPPSGCS